MSGKTVPCKNPSQCGVKNHIAGSASARECGITQASSAASNRASNLNGPQTSSGRSATAVVSLLGGSNRERSSDFEWAYDDEIEDQARSINEGKCPTYRMPSSVQGVDVEYTASGLDNTDVGASAAVILPSGVRVAGYDHGAQIAYTLADGRKVRGWCVPTLEDESGETSNADGVLNWEQYNLLSNAFDTCNEDFFSDNCESNRELAARLVWERENARAIHGG